MTSTDYKRKLLNQYEKEIREDWFKNHKAELLSGSANVVRWTNPESWCYGVIIIYYGKLAFFAGDLGEATFALTWAPSPQQQPPTDFSYVLGKLSACTDKDLWDSKLVALVVKEAVADGYLTKDASKRLLETADEKDAFQQGLRRLWDSSEADGDTIASLYSAGEITHPRKLAYWIAWQMSAAQLSRVSV